MTCCQPVIHFNECGMKTISDVYGPAGDVRHLKVMRFDITFPVLLPT